MVALAELYMNGDGVAASESRADALLKAAVAAGLAKEGWAGLAELYREDGPYPNPRLEREALEHASEAGDQASMVALAQLLIPEQSSDFDRLRSLLARAISTEGPVTAPAWGILGDLYLAAAVPNRDPVKAADAYEQATLLGHAPSMIKLARLARSGEGVSRNFDRARVLLETVVLQGGDNAHRAWRELGDLYAGAEAPNRDSAKAVDAYQQAADLGDAGSLIELAAIVGTGRQDIPADFDRAVEALRAASKMDQAVAGKAWALLGDLYRDTAPPQGDAARAVDAYQQAVDAGDQWSAVRLAQIVGTGAGVPPDFERARSLLETSIATGGEVATTSWATLAKLYADGSRPWHDLAKAAEAYQQAADGGDVWSMVSLARMLAAGDGVPVDFGAAEALLTRAIAEGSGDSSKTAWALLGDIYRDAPDGNRGHAVEAYQQAVDAGDLWSAVKLAEIVGTGAGVPPDFERARGLLERGIAAGGDLATTSWAALAKLYADGSRPWHDAAKAAEAYGQAADAGDAWSMIALARMLVVGGGMPRDFGAAEALLKRAIAEGNADTSMTAWGLLGDLHRDAAPSEGDPTQAVDAYQHAVDAGDLWSAIKLAQLLGTGAGVPSDFERARSLLEQGVAAGGDVATTSWATLAKLYADGNRPWHNPAKAAEAYRAAADSGDVWSMIALARMLAVGSGIPADFGSAEALLKRAISAGGKGAASPAMPAWALLGDLYRDAAPPQRDSARAVDAYQQAVDAGDLWSAIKLAQLLGTGAGVPPDFERARALLERGIAAGGDLATTSWAALAKLYADGSRPWHDAAKAAEAYGQAADAGDVWSMVALARMLAVGDGIPADIGRAEELLKRAIGASGEGKDSPARTAWALLGELYRDAAPPQGDRAQAVDAYQQAVDAGDLWSAVKLAQLVGTGAGVPPDFRRARSLLEQGIAAGGDVATTSWATLAKLYADGNRPWYDPAKAVAAYRKAADAGDVWSTISLARLVAAGRGVRANFDRAIALLDKAIAADPNSETAADAWLLKGDLYRGAKQPHRDPVKAADAYQKAADLGESWSLVYLADMLTSGDGVPVDRERARSLLEKAAARRGESQAEALAALGDFYRTADQPTYDLDVALGYYRVAADAGVGKANLAVVEITSASVQTPEERVAVRKHLRAAASSLGADVVGKAMFRMNPTLLYSLVQEMLVEAGYSPGVLDGIYGRQTRQAAREFCASERIGNCGGDFITLSLLKGLLEAGG